MPGIDIDVANVPDIIEAQLTLSYSRLTDLIRVIVEQGNSHEDDIEEIRDRLERLAQENNKLRAEVEVLKQAKKNDDDVAAQLEDLRSTVAGLSAQVATNTDTIASNDAAQTAKVEETAREEAARHNSAVASLDKQADEMGKRVSSIEKTAHVLQSFVNIWGIMPDQMMEMGRCTSGQEMVHSLDDRTRYLVSLPAFMRVHEEIDVVRALLQRQAADALTAKTSEAARNSRSSSTVKNIAGAAATPPVDATEKVDEMDSLSRALRVLEREVQAIKQSQQYPPPSRDTAALQQEQEQQQRQKDADKRLESTVKDIHLIHSQVALLENRLNTLLGQSGDGKAPDAETPEAGTTHLGLVDVARRITLLEDAIEGRFHGEPKTSPLGEPTGAAVAPLESVSGGEVVTAEGPTPTSPVRPSSRSRSGLPLARPPSGRINGSGLLPPLMKDMAHRDGSAASNSQRGSPTAQQTSSEVQHSGSQGVAQPTAEGLRRQEVFPMNSSTAADFPRRISLTMEPDDGLRRRVAQLEENTAILEVNKADRSELKALEEALRNAIGAMPSPTLPLDGSSHHPHSAPPPSFVPQRPGSSGSRAASADFAANQQYRPEGRLSRPSSSSASFGRPKFTGSGSVYLHDGCRLTNATVSPPPQYRP